MSYKEYVPGDPDPPPTYSRPGGTYLTMWGWILLAAMLVVPFVNLFFWIPLVFCRKRVPDPNYKPPIDTTPGKRPPGY